MHEGHRQRLKQKYLEVGACKMEKHELLELFLFFAIPRKDTSEISRRLLKSFGSLSDVFNASYNNLKNLQGIGENAALFIKVAGDIFNEYNLSAKNSTINNVILENTVEAGNYLMKKYGFLPNEIVALICLDEKRKVISSGIIFEGSINSVQISTRKIVEYIIKSNAHYIIICHNHPSGLAIPSQKDIETTLKLCKTLNEINVVLLDHIIIVEQDFVSLAQSNIIKNSV